MENEKPPDADPILTFKIDQADADTRLDAYLASQIEGWSRARLQQLIEDEDVLVNGKHAKSSYKLHAGDEVEVELVAAPSSRAFRSVSRMAVRTT